MNRRLIMICATFVALILEILPYGAVCNFGNPEGEPWRRTYSYFDLIPFGYANFAPFIVAILTCALLILIIIALVTKKQMKKLIFTVSAAATVLSLAPLLLGIDYFSIVGALISAALLLNTMAAFIKVSEDEEK